MRILYLAPEIGAHIGGIQSYCRELVDGIRELGHQVHLTECVPAEIIANMSLTDYIPRPYSWSRYYFSRGFFHQDYRYHNGVRRLFRSEVIKFQPDVVHCLHVYVGGAAIECPLPIVITCHGLEVVDCIPVRQAMVGASLIHCNSCFTAGRVTSLDRGWSDKTAVISWGIRPPLDDRHLEKRFDLITLGRLVLRKNVDTVIRALEAMPDIRYAVVGDGPELPKLKALAENKKLSNIQFYGSVDEAEKWELLLQSRVFILCPRHDSEDDVEGLGLVYYEAQRCGLPSIAARSGGVPDAVGDAGVLVDNPVDVDGVRRAIQQVLGSRLYSHLKDKVILRQHTHSWERFLDSFQSLYRTCSHRQVSLQAVSTQKYFSDEAR